MKHIVTMSLCLCGLWPLSSISQIAGADPVTGNAPINFYGRVVDQDGNPLPGVKVTINIRIAYPNAATGIKMGEEKRTPQSHANGDFTITGESGYSIKIESVEKSGYKLSPKVNFEYVYSWSGEIFHPDTNNRVIFKMWKERGAEPLVQPPAWNGNVACDGTTNRFDLFGGKRSPDGNLEIVCTRVPLTSPPPGNGPFDYKFEMDVRGGGIQPTDDEFTYLAPEKGYASRFIEAKKAGDPGWRGRLTQEYYIRTADGQYGRLSVDWYAAQNSPTHLDWNASINPSGSRNLER